MPPGYYETSQADRFAANVAERRAIAERAPSFVAPGRTILFDPSTTCPKLARRIARVRESVTVVTNSAPACPELGRGGRDAAIDIGGQFDPAGESRVDREFVSTKELGVGGRLLVAEDEPFRPAGVDHAS